MIGQPNQRTEAAQDVSPHHWQPIASASTGRSRIVLSRFVELFDSDSIMTAEARKKAVVRRSNTGCLLSDQIAGPRIKVSHSGWGKSRRLNKKDLFQAILGHASFFTIPVFDVRHT